MERKQTNKEIKEQVTDSLVQFMLSLPPEYFFMFMEKIGKTFAEMQKNLGE